MNQIMKAKSIRGEITIPGDKSISHRSVMFGSISEGITEVSGFLDGADCRSTIDCFRSMGIEIEHENGTDHVVIHGNGLHGLKAPDHMLDVGNSGTTTRLISGILAGQKFTTHLNGDESIQKRPMKRIMQPLTEMGAIIRSDRDNGCAPLTIEPSTLHGIDYISPVASAQVKSCVLLAGLYADWETSVTEPEISRDHSERMLKAFGATVIREGKRVMISPNPNLIGQKILVPGDISSAAYFIALALIHPDAELLIKNVNLNPTRAGIIEVAKAMGGNLEILDERTASGEPVGDILVKSSKLHGTTVSGELIPTLIDEIPIIAVMAAAAEGETIIKDAAELKVKESDRIASVTGNLKAMRCDVTPTDDGMIIRGGNTLHGATIVTELDHRIAMSFAIAGLIAEGETVLDHPDCVNISYPTFYETLKSICN